MKHIIKKSICLMLLCSACAVMLFGCRNDDGKTDNIIKSDNEDAQKAADVEEKELEPDSVVLSVGDIKATYKEFMVYMYILKMKYETPVGSDIWEYRFSEGRTFESIAREQVISHMTELKIISCKAGDYGIELGSDEKDEIMRYAENIMSNVSAEDIEKYMLDAQTVADVYMENEIADKVYSACIGSVDTSISDEDARQIKVQYIYLESGDQQKAEKLRKRAVKSKDFATFAKQNTDATGCEMTLGRGDMNEAFVNAAMALKKGEFSPVVTAEDGCYIIYCLSDYEEDLTAKKKEEIIEKAQREVFEAQYKDWAGEFNIQISPFVL